jgi:hypothetical protein
MTVVSGSKFAVTSERVDLLSAVRAPGRPASGLVSH